MGTAPQGTHETGHPVRESHRATMYNLIKAGRYVYARGAVLIAGGTVMAVMLVTTSTMGVAGTINITIDNLTPTSNYTFFCDKGGESSGTVCRTDNSGWTFYRQGSLESSDKAVVWNILFDEFEPTDLNVTHDPTPSYSGGSETDLIYKESSVPGSNEGITWCNDPSGTYKCDQHYVDIQPGHYSEGLTCHESGHAVGLLHGDDASPSRSRTATILGCMRRPVPSGSGWLGKNQRDNINGFYS